MWPSTTWVKGGMLFIFFFLIFWKLFLFASLTISFKTCFQGKGKTMFIINLASISTKEPLKLLLSFQNWNTTAVYHRQLFDLESIVSFALFLTDISNAESSSKQMKALLGISFFLTPANFQQRPQPPYWIRRLGAPSLSLLRFIILLTTQDLSSYNGISADISLT